MAITEQWNIKSRAHVCAGTGRPFEEGEVFHTALFESEDGNLERRDYSTDAWEAESGPAQSAFSHWRSTYAPPVREQKTEAVRKENAEELLRRLVTEDEAHTENARFILAVMLERQKILRQTDSHKIGETKLLIYEHRKTGDVLLVRDPEIPLADVDRVQSEVVLLLDQDHKIPAEEGAPEITESGEPTASNEPEASPENPQP
ncbi:MAG: hypothetical protein ACKO2G_11545 [Verrucomicrobiales bacterium]